MKFSVVHKLFLVILTAAALSVVSALLIMQWSLDRGFLKFINSMEQNGITRLATELEEYYQSGQNWEPLQRDRALWNRMVAASLPSSGPPPGSHRRGEPPGEEMGAGRPPEPDHFPGGGPGRGAHHPPRDFDQRLFLLDGARHLLIGHGDVPADNAVTAIRCRGEIVGYLGLLPRKHISDAPQQRFLREQKLVFVLVAGVVVLLSAVLSLLLARRLVRPLGDLTRATNQLAAGSFSVRVSVTSHDELGQLAGDFNLLALTLEKSEETRRQWVANISHELRTPIAVLRAEIEALQDGIRQPDRGTLNSLHDEVHRLGRLVEDLYQLSLSDVGALSYRKSELDLAELLTDSLLLYRSEFSAKGISLETKITPPDEAIIFGDPQRLQQLVTNLLDNSLKYTDAGGALEISLQVQAGTLLLNFQDSGPTVPEDELERLFERLYRVESSRNRATGGAGLGLAICRNIVEAHGGSIRAEASPLGGVLIRIEMPGVSR